MIENSNNRKGFTLVELLVVIVILAILTIIAVPQVVKMYNNSKLKSFEVTAKAIARDAYTYYVMEAGPNTNIPDEINCNEVKAIDATFESCIVEYNKGNPIVTVAGTGRYSGIICNGTKEEMNCSFSDDIIDVKTYVTFDANGGNFNGNSTLRIGYSDVEGSLIADTNYKHPKKNGNIFLGWYKDTSLLHRFKLNDYNIPENVDNITVYAKWEKYENIFAYTVNNNKATITGFNNNGLTLYNNDQITIIDIPEKIQDYDVVAINPVNTNNKFNSKTKITEIIIPDSVTSVSKNTFTGIPNLSKLTLPITLGIGNAFDTTKLSLLTLTKGANGVGYSYGCSSSDQTTNCEPRSTPWYRSRAYGDASSTSVGSKPLKVTFEEGIKSIGTRTFLNSFRTEIVGNLPNSLESIKSDAFNTSGLKQAINLPNSLATIEGSSFKNTLITKLTIGSGKLSIGNDAFINAPLTGTLVIPINVSSVGSNAFVNNKLTELQIKSDVTSFGTTPFKNKDTIKKLEMPITISGSLIYGATQLEELYLTMGTTGVGYSYGCSSSDQSTNCDPRSTPWYTSRELGGASATSVGNNTLKLRIGDGVKSIGTRTFLNSYRIQLVGNLPLTLESIKSEAFSTSGLKHEITLPNALTTIEGSAFKNTNIIKLKIGTGAISIGNDAFLNVPLTETLIIPLNVTSVGSNAFANNKLTELQIKSDKTSFGTTPFKNKDTIIKLEMPITLSGSLVYGVNQLEELNLTKGTNGVGYSYGCSSSDQSTNCDPRSTPWYTSRELGEATVSSIGYKPLKVTIGNGVKSIGTRTFLNSFRIQLVGELPSSLETIKSEAFNSSGLKQDINLPNSLTTIEGSGFKNTLITRLTIGSGELSIGSDAFINAPITGTLIVPSTVSSVGSNAFANNELNELKIKSDKTSFGTTAFKNKDTITKIEMPITLSGSLVYGVTKLEELYLTKGTTGVGYSYGCSSSDQSTNCDPRSTPWYTSRTYEEASSTSIGNKPLKVTIENGVKSIGTRTFLNSFRINLVGGLPSSLETIRSEAFNTSGLKQEISLPNSLTTIEGSAFKNTFITRVTIGSGALSIGSDAFINAPITGTLIIPSTVSSVGSNAFANNKLTELQIKSDKTSFGTTALKNSGTITKLEMPITLSGSLVYGVTKLEELYLTKGTTGVGYSYGCSSSDQSTNCDPRSTPWYTSRAYGNSTSTSIGNSPLRLKIGDGVKSIGTRTFLNSFRIQLVGGLPSSLETIRSEAFNTSGLKQEISLPNSLGTIEGSAFKNTFITNLTIGSGALSIGSDAFVNAPLTGTLIVPSTVSSVGSNAFANNKLTELQIKSDKTSFGTTTFRNKDTMKKLEIPITLSGSLAYGSSKLEELYLTKGTTGAGYSYGCSSSDQSTNCDYRSTPWYTSRELGGASVSSIGSKPLKVTLESGITSVGQRTFFNSYRVQLTSSVSGITIGTEAFKNSGAIIN